jgi:hypothetical protein
MMPRGRGFSEKNYRGRVRGSGFGVRGSGFRVQGSAFRVQGRGLSREGGKDAKEDAKKGLENVELSTSNVQRPTERSKGEFQIGDFISQRRRYASSASLRCGVARPGTGSQNFFRGGRSGWLGEG